MKCQVLTRLRNAKGYSTKDDDRCGRKATRAFLRVRPVNSVVRNGVKSVLPGTVVTTCEEHAEMFITRYISSYAQNDGMFREITLDEALVHEVQTG